jgi:hypothetical protein
MISFHEFFALNREIILFVYGLGFFILGLAIILQVQQSSRLELARSLRWLAAFGFTHAFNEWGDLFIPIQADYMSRTSIQVLEVFQLILLAVSFACLFEFGISVLKPFNQWRWLQGLSIAFLGAWVLVIFFVLLPFAPNLQTWHHNANALARYFIGFPGGLLAAYGLRVHAIRRILPMNVPAIFRTLRIAGISLAVYAVLGGLIPPPVNFFPGNILNTDTFEQIASSLPLLSSGHWRFLTLKPKGPSRNWNNNRSSMRNLNASRVTCMMARSKKCTLRVCWSNRPRIWLILKPRLDPG